jgi:alginate O-acetyltransferase complex protein AlgI
MQFNSYSYLLSLALAVAIFWALPVRFRRAYVLLVSLGFYATWNPGLIVLPLGLCAVTYLCARKAREQIETPRAKTFVSLGIAFVILVLVIAKYRGFLLTNLQSLIPSLHGSAAVLQVVLPLGISFYSFECISYLLDTRQRRIGKTGFMDLLLFVLFWPHLIAGPIVRFRELAAQLSFDKPFDTATFYSGLDRLLVGLVQKNVFANSLGGWADDAFLPRMATLNSSIDNWTTAIAFGLQIYFDFAAYSNMAIGAARLIGVTLPENFNHPYLAGTPPQFWSRWHMTLSRWVRDYLFFPLNAGFKNDRFKLYASLIGVMGLVGLWHGAGWGFVVWGIMHGTYLVLFRATSGDSLEGKPQWVHLLWRGLTLVGVFAAWVPFRAATLGQAQTMLASMFVRFSFGIAYSVNYYLVVLLCCCVCAAEPLLGKLLRVPVPDSRGMAAGANWYVLRPALQALLLLLFVVFDDRDTQFIYFQF